jgi:hypothetical protein
MRWAAILVALTFVASMGCSSTAEAACAADSDCPSGDACLYLVNDCGAQGKRMSLASLHSCGPSAPVLCWCGGGNAGAAACGGGNTSYASAPAVTVDHCPE